MKYHGPPKTLVAGAAPVTATQDDPENKLDTPETVERIVKVNAAFEAACKGEDQ